MKKPSAPGAPQIQDKIVKAYEQGLRDFDRAYEERELLVNAYAPGTWTLPSHASFFMDVTPAARSGPLPASAPARAVVAGPAGSE